MNKIIPIKDWHNYPQTKPKESGYYFTHYQDKTNYPDRAIGVFYYKCIYWCNKRQNWISWRSPFGAPHIFEVSCFVEKTRTDFYNPEKVEELYLDMTLPELAQMSKKQKLIKISEEILENGTKIIVLGDKETNGASFAYAMITFRKEESDETPDKLAQGLPKTPCDAL